MNFFRIIILLSTVFGYSGYSGLYYDDGFTLSGGYFTRESPDDEKMNGLKIGFSYLEKQKESESFRPTLFQSGILGISGFYIGNYMSYDDGFTTMNLDLSMAGIGLNFHLKHLKFGYNYESMLNASWDINGQDQEVDVSGYRHILSIGVFGDIYSTSTLNIKPFLDLNIAKGEFEYTSPGANWKDDIEDIKFIILGVGFKIDNIVIQPTILIPKDDGDKEFSVSLIYKI